MIPDEVIEAAAESLVGSTLGDRSGIKWEEFFEAARLALEAAAPLIRAQALEDAAANWSDWDALSAPEDWLRARAAAERGEG